MIKGPKGDILAHISGPKGKIGITGDEEKIDVSGFLQSTKDQFHNDFKMELVSSFDFVINVEIKGKQCHCLIDTGSSFNVITESLIRDLSLKSCLKDDHCIHIVGFNGFTSISRRYIEKIEIKIEDKFYDTNLIIIGDNPSYDLCLGLPFLSYHQCFIDVREGKLCFKSDFFG